MHQVCLSLIHTRIQANRLLITAQPIRDLRTMNKGGSYSRCLLTSLPNPPPSFPSSLSPTLSTPATQVRVLGMGMPKTRGCPCRCNSGQDKEWVDLSARTLDWWKTNKMAAKGNSMCLIKDARSNYDCTYHPHGYGRMRKRSYFAVQYFLFFKLKFLSYTALYNWLALFSSRPSESTSFPNSTVDI